MFDNISIELCEALNSCQQVFPGQYVPSLNISQYPNPTKVGEYCSKEEFLSLPKWQSSWVHWENRCDKILDGDYFHITPVHYEGIFTMLCNMMCPHCTRGRDRRSADAWFSPGTNLSSIKERISSSNTLQKEMIMSVIDQLSELKIDEQMGIVWGGGDPTMNPSTYDCIEYAHSKGVVSSFITNGVFIDIDNLFRALPTLIRISLNCCDASTYAKFHGVKEEWNYYDRIWSVVKDINSRKAKNPCKMLFGISLIVDERNINDFNNTIKHIVDLVESDGKGIDYIIIRPVMKYSSVPSDAVKISSDTKSEISKCFQPNSYAFEALKRIGVPIIPIKDSFMNPPSDDYYIDKQDCLAYGMCGEIRYNGDVQLCSDSYGNPEYTIGNLFETELKAILDSEKRKSVLKKINANKCFQFNCPHNSRGHHLNRMFYQIEELRKLGKIDVAKMWIEDMRATTYPLYHSFFI